MKQSEAICMERRMNEERKNSLYTLFTCKVNLNEHGTSKSDILKTERRIGAGVKRIMKWMGQKSMMKS